MILNLLRNRDKNSNIYSGISSCRKKLKLCCVSYTMIEMCESENEEICIKQERYGETVDVQNFGG